MKKITVNCIKCEGKGYLQHYAHVNGGTCYKCKGKGTYQTTEAAYKRALIESEKMNNYIPEWQQEENINDLEFKVGDTIQHGYFKEQTYKIIKIQYNQYITDKGLKIGVNSDEYIKIN